MPALMRELRQKFLPVALCLCVAGLVACGNKGPLYLKEREQVAVLDTNTEGLDTEPADDDEDDDNKDERKSPSSQNPTAQ